MDGAACRNDTPTWLFFCMLSAWNSFMCLVCWNGPILTVSEHFPLGDHLEANIDSVVREYRGLSVDHFSSFERFFRVGQSSWDRSQSTIARGSDGQPWPVLVLKVYGRRHEENCRRCPITAALTDHPSVVSVIFSVLPPGKSLPSHKGPCKGVLRYHLPLIVPSEQTCPLLKEGRTEPCHLIVGDEPIIWRQGQGVLFDDFYLHEAHNPTSRPRVVLFLDVLRSGTTRLPLVERANALIMRALGECRTIRLLMQR